MRNIITDGPLDAPPINDKPNPSNLDSVTDSEYAQSIEGHEVRLRTPMSDLKKGGD